MSDTGRWVTLQNGVRVFIDEGESVKEHFNKQSNMDTVKQYEERVKKIQDSSKRRTKLQDDVIHAFIKYKKYPQDDWRKQDLDNAIAKWEQHQEALRKQRDLAKRVRRGEATWLDDWD